MMLRLIVMPILFVLLLWPVSAMAEDGSDLWPPLPEAMLKDAEAAMFINRPRQMVQNMQDGGTEAGVAVDFALSLIAQQFYRCWALEGIDLDRPAMLLWRKGRAPLMAIIPISDREQFVANFGRVLDSNAMMIRVGEDAGTTVYKQNTEQGMIEYRLLIRNKTAYLGRSAPECKLLSEITLQEENSAPMYRFYIARPYDFFPRLADMLGTSTDPLEVEIKNLISSEWDLLLQQVEHILITAALDARQRLDLRVRFEPAKDSAISIWAARQQNQSSRLLSMLDFEKSSLAVYGNINWAGGIKETATRISKFIERYAKDDSAVTSAKALSAWGALFDRQAAFAKCLQVRVEKPGELSVYGLGVQEQPRAIELIAYQQIIDSFVTQFQNKEMPEGAPQLTIGDLESIGGHQAYWKTGPFVKDMHSHQVVMATDSHLLESWGFGDKEKVSERAVSITKQLDQSVSPIGEAGIVVMHLKLHNLLREISNLSGSLGYQIEEANITSSLSIDNDRNLIFKLDLPLGDVARAIRASDWTAVVQKMMQLVPRDEK